MQVLLVPSMWRHCRGMFVNVGSKGMYMLTMQALSGTALSSAPLALLVALKHSRVVRRLGALVPWKPLAQQTSLLQQPRKQLLVQGCA